MKCDFEPKVALIANEVNIHSKSRNGDHNQKYEVESISLHA
jgi:hypothetical protein